MSTELENTPRNLLVCEKSSFENEKSRLNSHVEQHYFNHKVSLLLPECCALPTQLASIINSFNKYYLIRSLPVYELLDKEFLQTMVYNGATYALSYETRIDEDNSFALLPNGQLILSVDKDTYEQLGLEGKPSLYNHKQTMRYVVTVNLMDKSMAPEGRGYQRVVSSLKDRLPLRSDFLLSRHNSGTQSDAALQSLLSRYKWTEHRPGVTTSILRDLPCPSLHASDLSCDPSLHPSDLSCDPHSFLEWLGVVDAGVSCDNQANSFLSSYVCPEPQTVASQALHCTITGLLLPEDIYTLVQELRRYFAEPRLSSRADPSLGSWLALTVHGFMDSPVSWRTTEHGFLKGGENFYSLVVFQNHDYQLYMATGSQDGCPP